MFSFQRQSKAVYDAGGEEKGGEEITFHNTKKSIQICGEKQCIFNLSIS